MKALYFTLFLVVIQFFTSNFTALAEDASEIRTKRVVKGDIASRGQFPYACHIGWFWPHPSRRDPKGGYPAGAKPPTRMGMANDPFAETFDSTLYQCSCAIIHERFVLTAAHCFQPAIDYYNKTDTYSLEMNCTNWPLIIRAGFVDAPLNEAGMQERNGHAVIAHWAYKNQSTLLDVDAALVRMKYGFNTKDRWQRVRPARIGRIFGPPNHLNIYCMGLGYGKDEYDPSSTTDKPPTIGNLKDHIGLLRSFKVQVGPSRYCRYLQRRLDVHSMYFDWFYLCAITNNATHKQHNCEYDIGGPLVCGGILMGVLAQRREKKPCDLVGNSFSMYTYVGSKEVMDWLTVFIADLSVVLDVPFDVPWQPEPPFNMFGSSGSFQEDDDYR